MSQRLTTINDSRRYDVEVHADGCRDILRAGGTVVGTEEWESRESHYADYNGDFIAEGSAPWPIHYAPCVKI